MGTKGPLIDHEGYPRADIDIYAVRTARNKIVCLQNDHKAVMRSVEQKLHQLHAQDRERRDSQHELPSNQKTNVVTSQGFVKVNEVTQGSPAAIAVSVIRPFRCFKLIITTLCFSRACVWTMLW